MRPTSRPGPRAQETHSSPISSGAVDFPADRPFAAGYIDRLPCQWAHDASVEGRLSLVAGDHCVAVATEVARYQRLGRCVSCGAQRRHEPFGTVPSELADDRVMHRAGVVTHPEVHGRNPMGEGLPRGGCQLERVHFVAGIWSDLDRNLPRREQLPPGPGRRFGAARSTVSTLWAALARSSGLCKEPSSSCSAAIRCDQHRKPRCRGQSRSGQARTP